MPAHPFISNFTGGEVTDQLIARIEWQKYQNCASCVKNFLVRPHGGVARRAGTMYVSEVKDSSARVLLHKFEFNITQAYVLEFGDLYIRFFANRGRVDVGGNPVQVISPYRTDELRSLRFEQSADVLYIAHPDHPPMKLQRTGAAAFQLDIINFNPPPTFEREIFPFAALTLTSASIGDGVIATTDAGAFLAGDVGRQIKSGVGRGVITAFASSTSVTITILDAFDTTGPIPSQTWKLDGSPNAGTLTPTVAK